MDIYLECGLKKYSGVARCVIWVHGCPNIDPYQTKMCIDIYIYIYIYIVHSIYMCIYIYSMYIVYIYSIYIYSVVNVSSLIHFTLTHACEHNRCRGLAALGPRISASCEKHMACGGGSVAPSFV